MIAVGDARDATLALLVLRGSKATICPSEVARALTTGAEPQAGAGDWRQAMPMVHEAVDRLVAEKLVRLTWKGTVLATRAGPYRISRRTRVSRSRYPGHSSDRPKIA